MIPACLVLSAPGTMALDATALLNLSVNVQVGSDGVAAGFIVHGGGGRFVILGESQYQTGVPLPDPVLVVRALSSGQVLAENDNWRDHPTASEVVASLRSPTGERDAALALTLPPGAYVAELRDRNGAAGQALVSIQQVTQPRTAATELSGVPCESLDLADGAVTSRPYPYDGWRCHDTVVLNDNGDPFDIRLRWNRPGMTSQATLVWLAGVDGRRPHGDFERGVVGAADSRSLRARLAEDDAIRSLEIQFLNHPPGQPVLAEAPGFWGYWSGTRRGYPAVARVYRRVLDFLQLGGVDLIRGGWTTLVGSSNGATVTAFALAYEDADTLAGRAVLLSGPFLVDVGRECMDPGYPAYMGINDGVPGKILGDTVRALVSGWNGWIDCRNPGLDRAGRSLLDPGARRSFPDLDIAVVMGAEDTYGPWILASNRLWFDAVSARHRTRVVVPGLPHEVWGVSVESEDVLYQALRRPPR